MKEIKREYSDIPVVSFDDAPEMAPYLAPPRAMYVARRANMVTSISVSILTRRVSRYCVNSTAAPR